jgi:DNA-binding transcriptional MocR family regulator
MPTRPGSSSASAIAIEELNPTSPYEKIAVHLRTQILQGTLRAGLPIPSIKELAATHGTSVSTAQRAVKLLTEWGLVELNSGRRTLVKYVAPVVSPPTVVTDLGHTNPARSSDGQPRPLDLEVRLLGDTIAKFRAEADPEDTSDLRQHLVGAIRRSGGNLIDIGDYELVVTLAGSTETITTFVATR